MRRRNNRYLPLSGGLIGAECQCLAPGELRSQPGSPVIFRLIYAPRELLTTIFKADWLYFDGHIRQTAYYSSLISLINISLLYARRFRYSGVMLQSASGSVDFREHQQRGLASRGGVVLAPGAAFLPVSTKLDSQSSLVDIPDFRFREFLRCEKDR